MPVTVTPIPTAPDRSREGGAVRFHDALCDAVMVSHIEEDEPAMIAPPVNPAGNAHALATMGFAQFAAGMGAIGVHDRLRDTREAGRRRDSRRESLAQALQTGGGCGAWGLGRQVRRAPRTRAPQEHVLLAAALRTEDITVWI